MDDVARVVLALEEHDVAEEVMHFLDRSGRARVVATAADDRQLIDAVKQLEPDAVVAQPALFRAGAMNGSALIAIDTKESVEALRLAIAAGAQEFFVWPQDRAALADATGLTKMAIATGERTAIVVGVYGPRGGVGTTFVATHLAQAIAHRGSSCLLVDMDPTFGDVTAAIGAAGSQTDAPRTIRDIAPMLDELTPEQLLEACWPQPSGFRVLLAPPEDGEVVLEDVTRAVDLSARSAEAVVLHLPRAIDGFARAGFSLADRMLIVLSLDVLCFRAAKRALALVDGPEAAFVVNRATRAEVTPSDVRRVFGVDPIAVLPWDPQVGRAQDAGRLLPARGRLGRAIDRLAVEVVPSEAGS